MEGSDAYNPILRIITPRRFMVNEIDPRLRPTDFSFAIAESYNKDYS